MKHNLDALREAIRQAGLPPPDRIIPDGKIHRFSTNGKRDDDSGWYIAHDDDVPVAVFGDWRSGLRKDWSSKASRVMTPKEQRAYQKRIETMKKQREKDECARHERAREIACRMWDEGISSGVADHAYLRKKCIQPHGIRIARGDGRLMIPILWGKDRLSSLQFIDEAGSKQFLKDGAVAGGYYGMAKDGNADRSRLLVGEGFATVASASEATGWPGLVAFSAGNLMAVARIARDVHPDSQIIILGDHDKTGVGQAAAYQAAEAVGGIVAIPATEGWDWNDAHCAQGLPAVKVGIAAVIDQKPTTSPALAREPNILAKFVQTLRLCGVVGEERCAQLLYLALTSRLSQEPVSLAIKGLSSSGKSFTTETTLKLFPNTSYISMTGMSERALVYMKEEFKHRTLVIFEGVALREQREKQDGNLTAYFVRTLLSEGRISYQVTLRDKHEGFLTKTVTKEGPTNVILTTTAVDLHGENETRMLSVPTDDSQEQTRAVMRRIAEGKAQVINIRDWQALQEWLETAEHRVIVPFAGYLAEQVPPIAVRLRRDFKSLLRLIEAHAILHQALRDRDEQGRIVATAEDYLVVRALTADLIASGVGATVAQSIRATVEAVQQADSGEGVTVKNIAGDLKLDRSAAQRRLQTARERGFIVNLEEKRGRPARYAIGEPLPEHIELLPTWVPGCATSADRVQQDVHTITPEKTAEPRMGVQVCSKKQEQSSLPEEIDLEA